MGRVESTEECQPVDFLFARDGDDYVLKFGSGDFKHEVRGRRLDDVVDFFAEVSWSDLRAVEGAVREAVH